MRRQKKSKYLQQSVSKPLAEFEVTERHLKNRVFVLKCIRKGGKWLVWGYDIIDEVKKFFGEFLELNMIDVNIANIGADPADENSFWIFFNHNHRVDNQMSNKNILRVEKP